MMKHKGPVALCGLLIVTALLFVASLVWGSVSIPASEVWRILCGDAAGVPAAWCSIVVESRVPQALTALLCGAALSGAGLILQTVFRNPLAGPSILGIDAGANLGVAIVMLLLGGVVSAGGYTLGGFALIIAAALVGAMLVMLLLLVMASMLRSEVMLLIVGMMISYLTSSLISLLHFQATGDTMRSFIVWGMGSFSSVTMDRLPYLVASVSVGLMMALLMIKPLNALLLGDRYARNLGVSVRTTRVVLLLICGLLTATCTAFCGPVAFLGLAVPHLARLVLGSSNHRTLMPACMLTGASLALLCNILSTLPSTSIIPINVITPLIGAPTVIMVVMRKK